MGVARPGPQGAVERVDGDAAGRPDAAEVGGPGDDVEDPLDPSAEAIDRDDATVGVGSLVVGAVAVRRHGNVEARADEPERAPDVLDRRAGADPQRPACLLVPGHEVEGVHLAARAGDVDEAPPPVDGRRGGDTRASAADGEHGLAERAAPEDVPAVGPQRVDGVPAADDDEQ